MATTIYLTNAASDISGPVEELEARVAVRGAGLSSGAADTATFAVILTRDTTNDVLVTWYTRPLDAVTISGTLTLNVWMSESNMSANVDAGIRIFRTDNSGTDVSTIVTTYRGVEVAVTTRAVNNWTASPTSTTLSAGDRLRFEIHGGDTLAQASGFTFDGSWGATSASVDGDTFVTFAETITEQVAATFIPAPERIALQAVSRASTY